MNPYQIAESRFDWKRFMGELGAVRALKSRPDEFLLMCPDCRKEKLAVNIYRKAWRCFSCGDGGRGAISLIAKAEQLFWAEAMQRVLGAESTPIGDLGSLKGSLEERSRRPPRWIPASRDWPPACYSARSYQIGRAHV